VNRALVLEQKSLATKNQNEAMMREMLMSGTSTVPYVPSSAAAPSNDLEILRQQSSEMLLQKAAEAKARLESCVAELESRQPAGMTSASSSSAVAMAVPAAPVAAPMPTPAPFTSATDHQEQLWTCSRAKQEADAHLIEAERRYKSADGAWRATEERSKIIQQEWTTERTLLEQEMREELTAIDQCRLESLRRVAQLDAACRAEEEKQKELREKHARRWAAERENLLREDDVVLKGLLDAERELKAKIPQLEAECKAQDAFVLQLEEELYYISQVKSSAMDPATGVDEDEVINDFLGTLSGFDFGFASSNLTPSPPQAAAQYSFMGVPAQQTPVAPPQPDVTDIPAPQTQVAPQQPEVLDIPAQQPQVIPPQAEAVQAQKSPDVPSGPQLKLMPAPPEWSETNAPLVKIEPSAEAPEPFPDQHLCGKFRPGYSSSVGPLSGTEPRQAERLPLSRLQQASNIEQVSAAALPEDNYSIAPQVAARPSSASRARELKGSPDIPVPVPSAPVPEKPCFQGSAADEVAAAIAQARSATQRIIWDSGAFGETSVPTTQEPLRQGVSAGVSETKIEANPLPLPPLSEPSAAASLRGQRREPQTLSTRAPAPPSLAASAENNVAPVMNDVRSTPTPPPQPAAAEAVKPKPGPVRQEPVQQIVQQQVVEAPVAIREAGKSDEPSALGPKPPAKLDLVSLDGTRPGSVGLRWGGDDNSHLSVSRVELQIWSVDQEQILPMLGPRGSPGTLAITTARLQGCTVAFAHDLNVSFPDPKAPAGAQGTDNADIDSPQIRAMLPLKNQQVAAHVGRASAPAPVSIEGIPRQKPVVVRMRLHSNTLSPSERLKAAGQRGKAEGQQKPASRSRYGAWGKPCLLVLLPDDLPDGVDLQTAVADEAASAGDDASLIKIKAWGNADVN
jgi:hypothetical protein